MINLSTSTKVITILDCCYSGAAMDNNWHIMGGGGGDEAAATLGTNVINKKSSSFQKGKGICLLASSQAFQEAYALKDGEYSIFTSYLIKGLKGDEKAIDIMGNVTADLLGKYV